MIARRNSVVRRRTEDRFMDGIEGMVAVRADVKIQAELAAGRKKMAIASPPLIDQRSSGVAVLICGIAIDSPMPKWPKRSLRDQVSPAVFRITNRPVSLCSSIVGEAPDRPGESIP